MQADGFAAAARTLSIPMLKPVVLPIQTFTFPREEAAKVLPGVVLAALAVELYLKCLLLLEPVKIPHSHNVKVLFQRLNAPTQKQLRKRYEEYLLSDAALAATAASRPNVSWRIDDVLEDSSDAFVQFRYLFEHPRGKPPLKAYSFRSWKVGELVRALILERQPDWGIQ